MSSPVTSVIGLAAYRRTIVACFVFRREISRKAVWDFFDSIGRKQTSAPAWQVGKVSKRGQRVPTGCDPLAAESSQGRPLGASPDGPDARPPSRRGCLVHSSVVRFES